MNIELLAVNKIEELVSGTGLLDPVISRGDREPSWDGFIYAYKNSHKRKSEMFGRAAIQVKGTTTSPRKQNKITYQVRYADINNYRLDGGALYFVVYINPDNTSDREVFFASLLPYKLNDLLKRHDGKDTFALHLEEFPTQSKDIENLVINFVENCQRQSSPTRKNWTLEELTKNFGLEQPQIKYRFTDVYRYKDPMEYLFNHFTEMYVPVDLTQQEYPIGAAKLEMIQTKMDVPVSVNGKQYFSDYMAGRNREGYTISIGGNLLMMIMHENTTSFKFKISGDLPTQISQAEFLLDFFGTGTIDFGDNCFHVNMESLSSEDKSHLCEPKAKNEWNKDLQRTLEILGVEDVLSFKDWKKVDAYYADQLIKGILYHEPVKLPKELNVLSIIKIGNISVGILCERLPSGMCKIENMFNKELNIFMMLDEVNVPTSQYVVIRKKDIIQMSNIDYDVILESVKKYHSTEHYTVVNRFALEMISAYDEIGNKKLLKAVIKLTKWLHTENPDDYYHLLNWYQAVYRQDRRDKRIDHDKLRVIMDEAEDDALKVGAAIVAEEHEKARKWLTEMQNVKREEFLHFPIANLLSKQ